MLARIFTLVLIGLFGYWVISPTPAYAQIGPWSNCLENVGGATNIPTLNCIPSVFRNVVTAALMFAGVIALFFVIFAGVRYITSRGDPKAVESARNTLTWAIIGLVVIFLSFAIITFISNFTQVSCITQFGFGNCQ